MDIGAELAQARERKGLSLAELARRTKLSVTNLQRIETGAMNRLAGSIYARGRCAYAWGDAVGRVSPIP